MTKKISTTFIYEKEISNSEKVFECDISCLTCYKEYKNNKTNFFECNIEKGYYPLYNDNSSCYSNETIIEGYYLDQSFKPFIWKQFNEKYESSINACITQINGQDILISKLKNKLFNNITSFINSTKIINSTNFIAAVLSSDNINPEDQIKNGISAVDLGNCTEIIKEYFNISKYESLIILNIETKNENNNNNDSSFNLGKKLKLKFMIYLEENLIYQFVKKI